MQFDIEFETGRLYRVLIAARQAITNPHEILESVAETVFNLNRDRHKQGLAPDGSKWKALSPLTLAAIDPDTKKPFKRASNDPLKRSGHMLQSLNRQVEGNTARIWFDGARDSKLAGFHHLGTEPYSITPKHAKVLAFAGIVTKRVNHPGLPKRQLVGFPDSDRIAVEDTVADNLKIILSRARNA